MSSMEMNIARSLECVRGTLPGIIAAELSEEEKLSAPIQHLADRSMEIARTRCAAEFADGCQSPVAFQNSVCRNLARAMQQALDEMRWSRTDRVLRGNGEAARSDWWDGAF